MIGKFDSAEDEALYANEALDWEGSVEWGCSWARTGNIIICEDEYGFVNVSHFDTEAEAIACSENLSRLFDAWCEMEAWV